MTANESISFYCLAFEVGNDFIKKVVRSALIPKTDTFEVKLWRQVTISENFKIQLEAYDSNNSLLIKTDYAEAILSPSVNGVQVGTDTSGQSLAGTVAANTAKLADFSTDENGNLLYKGKPVSNDRPTAMIECIGALQTCVMLDIPDTGCIVIGEWNDGIFTEIPFGAEIKIIEIRLESNEDWVDIHKTHEIDGIPYVVNMTRAFDGTAINTGFYKEFAIISPAVYNVTNFLYNALASNVNGDIRITYYTDNIGGENNA